MPRDNKTTAAEGLAAVLLPGLLCDRSLWCAQLQVLGARLPCIVPDYGALDSLADMARVVLARAPPRFVLIGHSMGGRVALEIMRRAAERVSALALLDTGYEARSPGVDGEAEARQRNALLQIAATEGMRAMGRVWVRGMVNPARLTDAALLEAIVAMLERRSPEVFAAQIRALLTRPDATEVLRAIRCPTLLLCGRQDTWSPLARHEAMGRLIEHSQLAVIEQCGHMSPMERPTEVSGRLSAWLAEQKP
jgi:pimeloyl-ACP methyl ester carboxylesterase